MNPPGGPQGTGPGGGLSTPRPVTPPTASDPVVAPNGAVFRFHDVELSATTPSPSGPDRVAVGVDDVGIEVFGPEPGRNQVIAWDDVDTLTFGVATPSPDGRVATPIDVHAAGQTIRLFIADDRVQTAQLSALEEWLAGWWELDTGREKGPASSSVAPPPPTPMFPVSGGQGPPAYGPPPVPMYQPFDPYALPPPRRRRARRAVTLVLGITLLVAAAGLAFGLSGTTVQPTTTTFSPPRVSADQQLAGAVMLTQVDLPQGWTIDHSASGAGTSPSDRKAEMGITRDFAHCMGLTEQQGEVVLGGQAADQTAQASSPIFIGPSSATQTGASLELQTAAVVVRTRRDEQNDFSQLSNPKYPQCGADAMASEVQLGVNDASGQKQRPGPATASVVAGPAVGGVQQFSLITTFSVSDRTTSIPVEVEVVSVGSDRIEANLQAFAIGGLIPAHVLAASVSAFELRVASNGRNVVV